MWSPLCVKLPVLETKTQPEKWIQTSWTGSCSKSIIPFLPPGFKRHFHVHTFNQRKRLSLCGSFLSFPPYIQAMTKPILTNCCQQSHLCLHCHHLCTSWWNGLPAKQNRPTQLHTEGRPAGGSSSAEKTPDPGSTQCSFSLPLVDSTLFLHEEGLFDMRQQELIGRCWRLNHRTPSERKTERDLFQGRSSGRAGWFSLPSWGAQMGWRRIVQCWTEGSCSSCNRHKSLSADTSWTCCLPFKKDNLLGITACQIQTFWNYPRTSQAPNF